MTSPIYYRFSEDGYFENSVHGAPDPLASKREGHPVFIQPHSSTLAVPEEIDGKWPKWNGDNWDYVTLPKTVDELIAFGKIKHDQQTAFWNKMTQLRNELLKEQKYVKQDLVDGWWEITKIPEPTAAELLAQKEAEVRSTRDYYLQLTDYLIVSDYPISEADKQQVITYRQSLRDLPETAGFPESIAWPEPPAIAKSAHKYWKTGQVNKEIKLKIECIKAREDLGEEQKSELVDKLQKLSQQEGFPYGLQWPEIPEVTAVENDDQEE